MSVHEDVKKETDNIAEVLLRLFNVNFEFLNIELLNSEEYQNTFRNDRVVFEDFDGNPLQLKQLINISLEPENNKNDLPQYKSLFNFQFTKPWAAKRYWEYFTDVVIDKKMYKSSFRNHACLLGDKFEIRGIAKSDTENHVKVLRVNRHTKCVLNTSNRLKVSELIRDARFKDTLQSVEANYIFPCGELNAKWTNCFNVFDWPDFEADCHTQIHINPETMWSATGTVKSELKQLKIMLDVYDNELPSWPVDECAKNGLTFDEFKLKLVSIINGEETSVISTTESHLVTCPLLRDRDISEHLWTLFKDISNRAIYRQCANSVLQILRDNMSKVEMKLSSNQTEFHKMLCERFLNADSKISSFIANVGMMVEVGIHKIVKDLIFVISKELTELSTEEMSDIFRQITRVDSLKDGIHNISNLYSCVLLIEVLKDLLNPPAFKHYAKRYVDECMVSIATKGVFNLHPAFDSKIQSINPKMRSLSSMWIIKFLSTKPIHNEKAVILEIENSEEGCDVYRHDMDLFDMQLPG